MLPLRSRNLKLLVLVGLLAACADPQAAQRRNAQALYDSALRTIAQAEIGYVPVTPGEKTSLDLQAYRQSKLQEAAVILQQVLDTGVPSVAAPASRLLADLNASGSRYLSRQAMSHWSELALSTGSLMRQIMVVELTQTRAQLITTDESTLLAQLSDYRSTSERRTAELDKAIAQHQQSIKTLQSQIATARAAADKARTESEELRAAAFVAQGADRYDRLDKADELLRQSQRDTSTADQAAVKLAVFEAELSVLTTQAQLAQSNTQGLTEQITGVEDRQRQMRDLQDQALTQKAQAAQELDALFQGLVKDYAQRVEQPFDQAADKLSAARDLLTSALNKSTGRDRAAAQLDLLANRLEAVHLLSERLQTLGAYGHTVSIVAQRAKAALPEQVQFLDSHAQQLAGKQDELLLAVRESIDAATATATELTAAGPDDPVAKAAAQTAARLQAYRQRIEDSRIPRS